MLKKFKNKKFISFITVAIIAVMLFVSCDSDSIESSSLESFFESESQTQSESVSQREPEDESSEPVESESETQSSSESQLESSTVDQKITYEEFIEDYKDIANNFALDQIETISYIKDSLSTSYTFKVSSDQITGMLVANVVKTGETERELKVANINFIPAIHVDDIANDTIPDNTAVTIVSDTKYSFDAKDEYIDQTTDIEDKLETVIKAELGDLATHEEQYIQESFAPETIQDLVTGYEEKTNEVLNQYFLDAALKEGRAGKLDVNKVHDAKWILNGEGNNISSLDFAFHYGNEEAQIYYLINLELDQDITVEDILNNASSLSSVKTTKTTTYTFNYNKSVQGTRDDLVNAIFEANGMSKECPEGATRLIVDNGYGLDTAGGLGESNSFTLVQIDARKIVQFSIRIKYSSDDAGYISKLGNNQNYNIYNKNEVILEGESLDYTPVAEITALSVNTSSAEAKTTVVSNKKKQKTEENIRSL